MDQPAEQARTRGPRTRTAASRRAQLAHIRDLCDRPGVSLRIVPETAGAHVGHDGDFKILTVGTVEVSCAEMAGMLGALHLEAEKVEGYARRWDRLSDLAWSLDESLGWIDNEMSAYT
ncbi:Scr1 family TA system antitoxin-like transcriptional regulator [Spirillospora sp. NPDC049652]